MSKKKYKFSIIVPIYNVEEYLRDTIESVVNQTIGFEDNIQLILVNDESPDNSESICLEYKEQYPKNIVYVKQKNGGVSSARNNGMKSIEGEYVSFLDSDDLLSTNALESVNKFFEANKNLVDVVATKLEFFDAKRGFNHPLNYKFIDDCVVDLEEESNNVQLHASSCFFKASSIDEKFDTNLKYGEDALFVNKIILKKMKLGLLSSVHYMYRKRQNETSAMDTSSTKPEYYTKTLTHFHKELFEFSKKKFGYIPEYIQRVVMYDLKWRLKSPITEGVISKKEEKEYIRFMKELMKEIDDFVIIEQRNLTFEYKKYILEFKNGSKVKKNYDVEDGFITYKGRSLFNLEKNEILKLNIINLNEKEIQIVGQANCPFDSENCDLFYIINGKKKKIPLTESKRYLRKCVTGKLLSNSTFEIKEKISYDEKNTIEFLINYKGETYPLVPNYTVHARLSKKFHMHYTYKNRMVYNKKNKLYISKKTTKESFKREIVYFAQLLKNGRFKQIIYRYLAKFIGLFIKKEIWLISDRTLVANDNGMHMFKYLNKIKDNDIIPYFVINKKSDDYKKLKQYGKVLAHNTFKYKLYFLMSNKIISSQADTWVINAFGKSEKYYRDMYKFDFIFLQHGITKNDQTGWLNYINKNIKILVTAAQDEYNSFIEFDYGYDKSVIKLLGFPRYDNLKDDKKNIVAIMPTWRQNLSGKSLTSKGLREYNPEFRESEYFKFYNNLINEPQILKVMREKKYKGIFVIHPSHMDNWIDFEGNDVFEVVHGYADYQKIFKEANILVSDYSSVTFDFAYLLKPIIYTQFDKKEFFESHLYDEGYFNDKRDGFGPVVTTYNDTVSEIIEYINSGCKLKDKYKKRVEKFYKFYDHKNCERVYKEIKKL